jgi:CRISP-associated protein Cas1
MRLDDLRRLPKFRDALSFLYVEHGRIEQEAQSIAFWDVEGKHPIPAAALNVLLLGPGVAITHAAVLQLADNDVLVIWLGEGGVRYYCHGQGGTRSAAALLHQAALCSNMESRLRVARRLYALRFGEEPSPGVFIGAVSALVREKLWEHVQRQARKSAGMLAFPAQCEQGFTIKTFGDTAREVVDFEGLLLIRQHSEHPRVKQGKDVN